MVRYDADNRSDFFPPKRMLHLVSFPGTEEIFCRVLPGIAGAGLDRYTRGKPLLEKL
jgi:hypothetical protein